MFDFLNKSFRAAPVSELELRLRTVSIRGRVAYCTTCLEIAFAFQKQGIAEFDELLSCLWNFTSSADLGDWEEKAITFYSDSILRDESDEQSYLTPSQFQRLKNAYSALPAQLLACIDETIEAGRGNLYAATVGYSASTLTPTMRVVRYMLTNGYPLPPIEKFLKSPFTKEDQHGWGKQLDRSFFQ